VSEARTLDATFALVTPRAEGAIGAIDVQGDVPGALRALGIADVPAGAARVRDLAGIDQGVVARWSAYECTLMPHAGPRVIERLLRALSHAGARARAEGPPCANIDDRVQRALATAASPLAIDLLLDQTARWQAHARASGEPFNDADRARWARLNRLLRPPLVATAGAPNIGKSSLLNALAGRELALVADAPGTTRDHVGALLNLGGLVVRWADTPGLTLAQAPLSPLDAQAQRHAHAIVREADLVLLCDDARTGATCPSVATGAPTLRARLRADDAPSDDATGSPGESLAVSARTGAGVASLVRAVREALVPQADIDHPGPWRWWGDDRPA
jgi:hypothetical protein